jgi:hypothetical protein
MTCFREEYPPSHPSYADGPASCNNVSKLHYSEEDGSAIKNWVRSHVGTAAHSM